MLSFYRTVEKHKNYETGGHYEKDLDLFKTWLEKKQAQQYLKVGVETIAVNLIGNEIFLFDFLCIIIGSSPALRWLLLSFDDI